MSLNTRIAEAIKESRKTKADIARLCAVTPASVTFWLNGETKSLKAETALALEQATGYRAIWILRGLGPRKVGESSPAWPFPKVPIERVLALDEDDRGYVQKRLLQAIAECDSHDATPSEIPIDKTVVQPVRTKQTKNPTKKMG